MNCKTCKWWKERFYVRANCIDSVGTAVLHLGYCEPINPECTGMWKGLTASDYSCGEHKKCDDG